MSISFSYLSIFITKEVLYYADRLYKQSSTRLSSNVLFLMSRLNGLNPFAHYLIIPIAGTIRKLKIQTVKSFIDFVHTDTHKSSLGLDNCSFHFLVFVFSSVIKIKKGNKVIAIFEIVERPKVFITIEKRF